MSRDMETVRPVASFNHQALGARDGELVKKKSPKPELGMIIAEEEDGFITIQFESKEHETERLEMLRKGRYRKLSGWLRYPRVFEGHIQKVQPAWIQKNRPPPRLCSCKLQDWGHLCECSGITCSRGTTHKIWGAQLDNGAHNRFAQVI
eukprot:s2133_g12.t1